MFWSNYPSRKMMQLDAVDLAEALEVVGGWEPR